MKQVACYVVCDSLEARILVDGLVVRQESGATLGPARDKVIRYGVDTVRADRGSLDSLRASLAEVDASGLEGNYRQGVPPCNDMISTHTPVVSITWGDVDRAHSLGFDTGCRQPSNLLDATVRYAQQAALFRGIPVRQR